MNTLDKDRAARPEKWAPVPGYEGDYEVSDQGKVRSYVRRGGPRMIAPRLVGPAGKQYHAVTLRGGKQVRVHRLVLAAFIGPCPEGLQGCHNNGDKLDNRLVNLRWDTPGANNRDKRVHGTDHQVRKTHCPRGHEYTPENCYDPTMTVRRCKLCARAAARHQHASGYVRPSLR